MRKKITLNAGGNVVSVEDVPEREVPQVQPKSGRGKKMPVVLEYGPVIGWVWYQDGSWSAEARGETYHGFKSRSEAIARVEQNSRSTR